jgi:hypothetical protein
MMTANQIAWMLLADPVFAKQAGMLDYLKQKIAPTVLAGALGLAGGAAGSHMMAGGPKPQPQPQPQQQQPPIQPAHYTHTQTPEFAANRAGGSATLASLYPLTTARHRAAIAGATAQDQAQNVQAQAAGAAAGAR